MTNKRAVVETNSNSGSGTAKFETPYSLLPIEDTASSTEEQSSQVATDLEQQNVGNDSAADPIGDQQLQPHVSDSAEPAGDSKPQDNDPVNDQPLAHPVDADHELQQPLCPAADVHNN